MDSVAWRIGVRGGPSQLLRRCGGGVGSDVSDCLLALASGCHSVTGHYQLHGVWSGLRLLFKADRLVALPVVARAWPVRPVDTVPAGSISLLRYDHVLGSSVD